MTQINQLVQLDFGEWLPDLPELDNPGCITAQNVIPAGASYQPFPSSNIYSSNALTARAQGAVATKDTAGVTVNIAGDASKLYKLSSTVFSNISKTGGYATGTDERWSFTRFGNLVIATNYNDNIQSFTLGGTAFADLGATAPKARYLATSRNFLITGNTFDAVDGAVPHRVRWSAYQDPTNFTVSPVTQSDYNDLEPDYGWVRGIVGGEYVTIFQERAITRMSYVGSPTVWRFDVVESARGARAPGSIIKVGNNIFYLGQDGFYVFDGNSSQSIGENKVNKYFLNDMDFSYASRISSTVDYNRQVIYWLYPGSGNTAGRGNKILMFNYSSNAAKRWSYASNIDLEILFTSLSEGYTLEGLDSVSTNLDTLPFSLDSRAWTGDNFILSAFDNNHTMVNFNGSATTALLETGEKQITPAQLTEVLRVRPVISGSGTVTLNIGTRNLQSDSVTYTSNLSPNSVGDVECRANARFHRVRANISGGFNNAQGIQLIEASASGRR
jgi:hypothetical protein